MLDGLIVQLLILGASLVVLALSSHYTIKAIEKIIALTGLSEMSAGFILLATLTSVPEIIVALFAVLQGDPGISVGDILGSNVFNIGAVLGILAIAWLPQNMLHKPFDGPNRHSFPHLFDSFASCNIQCSNSNSRSPSFGNFCGEHLFYGKKENAYRRS